MIVPPFIVSVVTTCDEAILTRSPLVGVAGNVTVNAKSDPAGLMNNTMLPVVATLTVLPVVGATYWTAGVADRMSVAELIAPKSAITTPA